MIERKLTCCGDEPYNEENEKYALKSDYLLHEAFVYMIEADIFHPYENIIQQLKMRVSLLKN
ncbi:MAG: hypothetical protein ACLR43_00155 [Faecalibacillus faecis]